MSNSKATRTSFKPLTYFERVRRILKRCEPHRFSTCILWTGPPNVSGYGRVWFPLDKGDTPHDCYVHRVLYTLLRGPIPEGLTLDHDCETALCVNPYHLVPCTVQQNRALAGEPTRFRIHDAEAADAFF